jgi:hypothetical protein
MTRSTPVLRFHKTDDQEMRWRKNLHALVDMVPAEYLEPATWLLDRLASDSPHAPEWWSWYQRWVAAEAQRARANGGRSG